MPNANIAMPSASPTVEDGVLPSEGTPLPRDIVERARDRVRIAAFVLIATWGFVIVMNEIVARIVPSSPRKTLLASLLSATTVPIAIWYGLSIHPNPQISGLVLLWLVLPGYVCAILAVVPANVIRTLGRQVRKARELGSYQLEDRIGKGGMGEVYRAKHRLLARPAAVKLISPAALRGATADENRIVIERFRREAEAAATLRSPHTIELYDYGVSDDGAFYYVMELAGGNRSPGACAETRPAPVRTSDPSPQADLRVTRRSAPAVEVESPPRWRNGN